MPTRPSSASPLASALRAAVADPPRPARPMCSVCTLLRTLGDTDAEALRDALRSPLSGGQIERILTDAGARLAENQINRHRRRQCATWAEHGGVR